MQIGEGVQGVGQIGGHFASFGERIAKFRPKGIRRRKQSQTFEGGRIGRATSDKFTTDLVRQHE